MATEASDNTLTGADAPPAVDDKRFKDLIAGRARTLLGLAHHLSHHSSGWRALTMPILAELLSKSTHIEELMDVYGAANNRRWAPLRSLMATIKLFTGVSYVLLHIRHAIPSYRLLPLDEDFTAATDNALDFTAKVLLRTGKRLIGQAKRLHLPVPTDVNPDSAFEAPLPPGRLPHDRATRRIDNVTETVTHLATAFLNLAAESDLLHAPGRVSQRHYASCIPDPIGEETLRDLELRFHNLQSLYDTYVSQTHAESIDPDLPVLRGHITVIFHLLETATAFVHFYQRHVSGSGSSLRTPNVPPKVLLSTLMDYSLAFASRYLIRAQQFCRQMLTRYARATRIEVSVPRYRGFHVRPSTLVAKIVLHYGSDVQMQLDSDSYSAASPLDIFRANEKINATKRRWLASQIEQLPVVANGEPVADIGTLIRRVVLALAEGGKLVMYEQPLVLRDDLDQSNGTTLQRLIEEIARLQATGKIDIATDLKVTFIGDERVLADLKLLAENGYGEDNFGNNIPLPERLAYLRR